MNKNTLKRRYYAARVTLLGIILFIAIDSIILSISADASLLFTMVIPQLAIAYSRFYFSGFQATMLVLLFVICPLLLNIICLILSKYERKWLGFTIFMAVLDFIALITFMVFYGFEVSMLIDVAIELCIIVYLLRGFWAAKALGEDLELEDCQDPIANPEYSIKAYRYDKMMAQKNKVNRGGLIIVAVLGLIAGIVASLFILGFVSTYSSVSNTGLLLWFSFLLAVNLFLFIRFIKSLHPYTSAKNVQYFALEGEVYRCYYEDAKTAEKLGNLIVEKKTSSEYRCFYTTSEGKTKKLIIPNCYPGIEEIL